jgi:hypothetical protein
MELVVYYLEKTKLRVVFPWGLVFEATLVRQPQTKPPKYKHPTQAQAKHMSNRSQPQMEPKRNCNTHGMPKSIPSQPQVKPKRKKHPSQSQVKLKSIPSQSDSKQVKPNFNPSQPQVKPKRAQHPSQTQSTPTYTRHCNTHGMPKSSPSQPQVKPKRNQHPSQPQVKLKSIQ